MSSQVPSWVAWIFCSAIGAAFADEPLRLSDCRLESAVAGGSVAARCGKYRVRENRDDPQKEMGKELQLHVAVIPALRLKPAADPLFILSGGPGQAASDFYLSVGPAFARIRRDRDLVIVDQRGTGRSNRLDCALPDDSEFVVLDPQKLQAAVRECLAALPGDPRYYTTSIAVRDLDDIRAALGYSTLNIYGISYGTRVAQHYMRRYPDRVRSAVLDGVVPAEVALGPDVAIEAQTLREPQALAAQYLRVESDLEEQIAAGMHFAVVCSEDAPRWDRENVSEQQLAKTYLGTAFMRAMRAVCEQWPRGPVDPDFGAPLQSSVPTLILSGSNDPVTPEFIAAASTADLDEDCVRSIRPTPFMLSRSAPAP